jgi:AcrR family transcriptional regulator
MLSSCLAFGSPAWQGGGVTPLASTRAPSPRRIGAEDSNTRARLLDAAEVLMLEEGYAAVTSRRVAAKAGLKPQLVHYYFRTMDDLFLAVFRRRADDGFAHFERAIAAAPTLRTIWSSLSGPGSKFNLEFIALANHRKAIRAEIASYAERFRTKQLEAISSILAGRGPLPEGMTPEVVLVAMAGVAQIVALERTLGVSGGHDEALAFVERYLDT